MSDSGRGSLVIVRAASLGRDMFRAYKLYAGIEVVGEVKPDREARITPPPGVHLVQMKIDWYASPGVRVEVAAGSEVRLACGPNPSGRGPLRDALSNVGDYLWLRPEK